MQFMQKFQVFWQLKITFLENLFGVQKEAENINISSFRIDALSYQKVTENPIFISHELKVVGLVVLGEFKKQLRQLL